MDFEKYNHSDRAFIFIGALESILNRESETRLVEINGDFTFKKKTPKETLEEIKRLFEEYNKSN